jgi:DNA-binding NarL/FixJ family response regulator
MSAIRILLADDHVVMRSGLRLLLERQPNLEVIGEAADGQEAVRLAAAEKPEVVIMDIAT